MDISGMDKGAVLAALYNRAKAQGMGFLQYDPTPMTEREAQQLLDGGHSYFDYLKGRVMKVDLSGDELDTRLYNRDNGENAAENAIAELVKMGDPNSPAIQEAHQIHTRAAAGVTKASLGEETIVKEGEGVVSFTLGLSDVAEYLQPAVDRVLDEEHEVS